MRTFTVFFVLLLPFIIPLSINAQVHREDLVPIQIPSSITDEHKEIHLELKALTQLAGETGLAARAVAEALHGHFEDEEEYALPPLGILQDLVSGSAIPYRQEVLAMSERLERNLPDMLAEHRVIHRKLDELRIAAKKENQIEAIHFADKLQLHAQNEEQVLYPSAILVGKYIKAIITPR